MLALVHLFAGRLRFLEGTPRSRWLSFASGVAVAYVFARLLPEVASAQRHLEAERGLVRGLEHHAYLLALAGVVVFYGLERVTVGSRQAAGEGESASTSPRAFWLSIGSFAFYTGLIGHTLIDEAERGPGALVAFTLAMALHFVVNDYGLREHHRQRYVHIGRWLLAAAVLVGWLLARLTDLPETAVVIALAFLAGGVVLNVLKEELPERRRSRFWAFALGAAGYAGLLQLI